MRFTKEFAGMADMEFSPFQRQCFVVLGASLNMAQLGLVMGFTALLLPQLRYPGSIIPIDDITGSWIAAIPTLALLVGNVIIPTLMDKCGRKISSIVSILIIFIGWCGIIIARSAVTLLMMRFLQGTSIGMASSLSPILVGEYTSPSNRGAFLTTLSLVMSVGTLSVHVTASYVSWQNAAGICAVITFVNLLIVIYSPESPSWLAGQGRYKECRNVFRWLRGVHEDDELNNLTKACEYKRKNNYYEAIVSEAFFAKMKKDVISFAGTVKKKEFYKPIFIAVHMLTVGTVCGINILSAYIIDIINDVANSDVNMPLAVICLDIQRLVSNIIAIVVIKKMRRRTVLFSTVLLNIIAFFSISAYTFAKANNILSFDSAFIGFVLIHILMFSIAIGTLPLTFTICGELFSMEYRSLSGGISNMFLSVCFFVIIKTFPYLHKNIGLYGTFNIYACILCYCSIVLWFFLPETKDRTLQDIEYDFRGRLNPDQLKSVQSLMSQRE